MPDQNQTIEQIPAMPKAAGESGPVQQERAESSAERVVEVAAPRPSQRVPVRVTPVAAAPVATPRAALSGKSETLQNIESIMEERLKDVYKAMPPDAKAEFRAKGEVTAKEIETLMYKVKLQTKRIFQLLFDWLKVIPGVNKFFLEQEAKLKTDELIRLKQELEKRGRPKMNV